MENLNLKMLVSGRQLNVYQKALAKREFEGLLERLELFEQQLKILNIPVVVGQSKQCRHDKEPITDKEGFEVCPGCGEWGENC